MTPLVIRVEDTEASSVSQSAHLKSPVRIGRGELNDLQLDYPFVSTWHAVLRFEEGEITYVDLGSTNGSFLGGQRLEKNAPVALRAGDEVRIGGLLLQASRRQLAQAEVPRTRSSTQFAMKVAEFPSNRVAAVPPAAVPPPAPEQVPERRPPPPGSVPVAPAAPAPLPAAAPVAAPVPAAPAPASAGAPPAGPTPAAFTALENASWQLGVLHEALAEASRNMDAAVEQALVALGPADRAAALALVAARYPLVARAAPAAASPATPAPAPAAPEPAQRGSDAGLAEVTLRLLRAFGESYLPASAALDSRGAVQAFLGATAELLETAARSFIELRGGYDEFGREMGIRVARGEGQVASAHDARELLAYLLAPSQGTARAAELGSAFADLMMHQLALLAGVTDGARDVLDRLSPERILVELEREGGLQLKVKALREGAQWRAFLDRFRELEEEGTLTATLFGKSFLRSYAAVAGRALQRKGGPGKAGRGRGDEDDEDDDRPRGTPPPGSTRRRS